MDCSHFTSHASGLLCFQNLGPNSCFPPSQSRDCIVRTPLECFACFLAEFVSRPRTTPPLLASWQNLSLGLERPLHKQISESNCTSYSEKGLVAQTHIFNTIKPLLVLTSSPSRTNTNFNTLQCSFPKPPLKQPLSHPFPRTTPIPPSLLSHNRKSFGASAMAPARLRSLVGRAQRPF